MAFRPFVFAATLLMASHLVDWYSVVLAGQKEDSQPLFQISTVEPQHLAALVIAGGIGANQPQLACLSVLVSGEENSLGVWSLSGPFAARKERALLATVALLGMQGLNPTQCLQALEILKLGDEEDLWTLINSDVVYPVPVEYLDRVKDEKPIQGPMTDDLEATAYIKMVHMAYQTDALAFRMAARKDLNYADLMRQPKTYRGEIVQVSGKLRRLRKIPSPLALKDLGVSEVYEGWVFQDIYGANPICLIFSSLPQGLQPYEKGENYVSFSGYFFKKYRYRTASDVKESAWKDAPLLIGRTVDLLPSPPKPKSDIDPDWAQNLLPAFLGFVIVVVVTIVGLSYWFLKTDKEVKNRLKTAQNRKSESLFQDFEPPNGNQNPSNSSNITGGFGGYKL